MTQREIAIAKASTRGRFHYLESPSEELTDRPLGDSLNEARSSAELFRRTKVGPIVVTHSRSNTLSASCADKLISAQQLKVVAEMSGLSRVTLIRCSLDADAWQFFALMKNVTDITCDDTNVPDDAMEVLAGVPCLGDIDVDRSNLSDTGATFLVGMHALGSLKLRGTRVTDKAFASFVRIPHLNYLDVRDTRVSKYSLKQFQLRRPDVRVISDFE